MPSLPIAHLDTLAAPTRIAIDNSSNTLDLRVAPKRREFTGIQRGREFTYKIRRLASAVAQSISLLVGGSRADESVN
jgi:hypothetical protein